MRYLYYLFGGYDHDDGQIRGYDRDCDCVYGLTCCKYRSFIGGDKVRLLKW